MTHVVSFVGDSGSGKTTLIASLISEFKHRGLRVSTIKHSHHLVDTDLPQKDTWRMKKAGSFETVLVSNTEIILQRSFEKPYEISIHEVLAQMFEGVDWIFVEGFKHSDLLKIEVLSSPPISDKFFFESDDFVIAVAFDLNESPTLNTSLPLLNLNRPVTIADWILHNQDRFLYSYPFV
jgi:molybdopterin-guanine dinucleotide biosynthesis adapter protein